VNLCLFYFRRVVFSSQLKSKIGSTLAKVEVLRSNLNLDGTPITSKSHTHPSHSQTSRLLTLSLSHRQSYIGLLFRSRFIDS
jgi:hypothetical protein